MKFNATFVVILVSVAFLTGALFGKYQTEAREKTLNEYQECLQSEKQIACRAIHFNY